MLILSGYIARQTNHSADLHPFIVRIMYDQPLSSEKTGNAHRRPVKCLICSRNDKRYIEERDAECMNFPCQGTMHTSAIL